MPTKIGKVHDVKEIMKWVRLLSCIHCRRADQLTESRPLHIE